MFSDYVIFMLSVFVTGGNQFWEKFFVKDCPQGGRSCSKFCCQHTDHKKVKREHQFQKSLMVTKIHLCDLLFYFKLKHIALYLFLIESILCFESSLVQSVLTRVLQVFQHWNSTIFMEKWKSTICSEFFRDQEKIFKNFQKSGLIHTVSMFLSYLVENFFLVTLNRNLRPEFLRPGFFFVL